MNRLIRQISAASSRARVARASTAAASKREPALRSTQWSQYPPHQNHLGSFAAGAAIAVATVPWWFYCGISPAWAEAPTEDKPRKIRLSEVRKHGRRSEKRWVVRGNKVYDITEWIPNHPGGEVILRAVGGVIDTYWEIFSIHKKQEVYDILEQYYIGDVDPRDLVDGRVPQDGIEDPFEDDPLRHSTLKVHTERPCNAESPVEVLDKFITPSEQFYVRNHLWAPKLDPESYRLTIELPDGEEVAYSLEELKKFPQVDVTATLQCSGNRRKHMTEGSRYANGLQWGIGAISNASFRGVRLRDILAHAGFDGTAEDNAEIKHVQFQGAEAYGASIPLEKALSQYGDVLLVHEMNGQPLPQDHGFPLRVLVPGHVAARSVKWLKRISLAEEESQSQWQQRDYKCFGPNQSGSDVDWAAAPAIQETPVQSAITSVKDLPKGERLLQVYGLEEDSIEVKGYAFAGGGRRIVRVDVSPDDGRSWTQAELLEDEAAGRKRWAWTQWKLVVPRRLAGANFVVKAVDEGYNTQPGGHEPYYNFRGNLTGAWHRVPYKNRDPY
ncbi:Sulfite oxidase, mitochondrial [Cyphellophora attinorum]|uniref:Nitrate reductase [NADPH] n=1 Tax=Cyphellophora attinorum TaxID=1664694 RepID=A0A0N1H0X1_9EURO|nr:Sulfite oxidase, mitochondrial [Phialophora attinorum]KPI37542.1 Sulfite oxidase, mitochondrial [Phialophora attinorum]